DYAFSVLNMHKIYLVVDKENEKAVRFIVEGELLDEFFVDGNYHNAIRMCMFQKEYFKNK
ncbi:spermidine acetyltransferase, partial [Bacillus cereus]|nr:spermidine acetyltransferase [Bacillus cereus]